MILNQLFEIQHFEYNDEIILFNQKIADCFIKKYCLFNNSRLNNLSTNNLEVDDELWYGVIKEILRTEFFEWLDKEVVKLEVFLRNSDSQQYYYTLKI